MANNTFIVLISSMKFTTITVMWSSTRIFVDSNTLFHPERIVEGFSIVNLSRAEENLKMKRNEQPLKNA